MPAPTPKAAAVSGPPSREGGSLDAARQLGDPGRMLGGGETYESVADQIGGIVLEGRHPRKWWVGFAVAFALLMLFFAAVTWLLYKGVGVWGINIPVAWGFAIVNFVWWIG